MSIFDRPCGLQNLNNTNLADLFHVSDQLSTIDMKPYTAGSNLMLTACFFL